MLTDEQRFEQNLAKQSLRKNSTQLYRKTSHKKKNMGSIKLGPANVDILEDSSGSESDVEVMRIRDSGLDRGGQNPWKQTAVFDNSRTDSVQESHYSRGSIHNIHASPGGGDRDKSFNSDHRGNLPQY